MRCSVSPFARASCACILMQLAQPLIWEARISTSLTRVGSRLEAMASDVAVRLFKSSGGAAKRAFAVMGPFLLLGVQNHNDPEAPPVTCTPKKFAGRQPAGR